MSHTHACTLCLVCRSDLHCNLHEEVTLEQTVASLPSGVPLWRLQDCFRRYKQELSML